MPIGGRLILKGGEALKTEKKRKRPISQKADTEVTAKQIKDEENPSLEKKSKDEKKDCKGASIPSLKSYDEEFELESLKRQEGKSRTTPWGSSYRAPPEILHGYSNKVKGVTADERLDLRCAAKADKFCK